MASHVKLPAGSGSPLQTRELPDGLHNLVVGTGADLFRDEFATLDSTVWETVQTGSGMTVTQAGVANGARYLNVATGTTTNSETIFLTKEAFSLPVKLSFALSMSQRIANQEVFVELVGVDPVTGAVETDTTIVTAPNFNNAKNAVGYKFDSTTATSAIYNLRGFGISELISGSTAMTATTVATGSGPNFLPAHIWEINVDSEEVLFTTKTIDAVTASLFTARRSQYLPDPNKLYKIRFRVKNLAVAPASTTDVRLHFVRLLDTTRFTVDMSRAMGHATDIQGAVPVAVANTPAVTMTSTTVSPVANTTLFINSAASTNATSVVAAAGTLVTLGAFNNGAGAAYVKLYNKASAPTVGTDVPVMVIPVAAGAYVDVPLGALTGVRFATGIALAITGGAADSDTTAVAASQVKVWLGRH